MNPHSARAAWHRITKSHYVKIGPFRLAKVSSASAGGRATGTFTVFKENSTMQTTGIYP